jgi:hypothetical protein
MLRPGTPLTVLLFAAFALLLLAVISTPIVEAIPLSDFGGVTYGVFGYCQQGKGCSGIGVGYDTGQSTVMLKRVPLSSCTDASFSQISWR